MFGWASSGQPQQKQCDEQEVAMRSQHLSSLEAIRFGETMRIVATQRQQEANATGSGSAWKPPNQADGG